VQRLIDGIARYSEEIHTESQPLFDDLAEGQSPDVLFLTCADSRVDPSLITQTKPGEIFVCRNAGNIVPPSDAGLAADGMAASIEFAVKALQVADIVVCGHADCGAVKGAMAPESIEPLPYVGAWLQYADHGGKQDLDEAIEANVLAQLDHLRTYEFINEAIANGSLTLSGCVYDIGSGLVRVYDGTDFVVPTRPTESSS
ncbi:UNVERIFIED_CONTAM: hypothetical protein GTU68_031958, partial [Idotea baltica]|nr:hypothetical protein [Idotea baltica]